MSVGEVVMREGGKDEGVGSEAEVLYRESYIIKYPKL